MKNSLVSEKVRYEEVKSLAPTLHFPKLPFPSLSATLPLTFPTFPIHYSSSTTLPSFSLPHLPCPFCSSLIPIFLFPSQPSSFHLNLPVSLDIFPFPSQTSFSQPSHSLPYLSPSLPTYLLHHLSTSLPIFPPSKSFPTHPFLLWLPSPFYFPLFSFSFPSPSLESFFLSPRGGGRRNSHLCQNELSSKLNEFSTNRHECLLNRLEFSTY